MDYKFKKKNYEFWVEILKKNKKTQVCTNDIGLDELESKQILSRLKGLLNSKSGLLRKQFQEGMLNLRDMQNIDADEIINGTNKKQLHQK